MNEWCKWLQNDCQMIWMSLNWDEWLNDAHGILASIAMAVGLSDPLNADQDRWLLNDKNKT